VIAIILIPAYFILKNNKLESLGLSGLQISLFSSIIFLIFALKSIYYLNKFKSAIGVKNQPFLKHFIQIVIYPYFYSLNKKHVESYK
jgi:hypothetical protein